MAEMFTISRTALLYHPTYLVRKYLYQAVLRHGGQLKGKMLDLGCGSKPYKSVISVDEYIGLDYDTEISQNNHNLSADFFYDGHRFPFDDATFDSAFSSEVLEHIFNPAEVLGELHRVLKPGATVLLTCPFYFPEHEQPYDFARYSSFGLKHIFQEAGFEVVKQEKTGSYMECLIQSIALYLFFFIPNRPGVLERIFFVLFITPWFLLAGFFRRLLPKKILRSDFYLNNVIVVRKPLN